MFNTFNMGVGLCVIVPKEEKDNALSALKEAGEDAYVLGYMEKATSESKVRFA